jgi:hypothetical protein
MMARNPEIFGSAIVAIGTFNPVIFTPDWLERNNLIGVEDASVARQDNSLLISTQICQYQTDWFSIQIFDDRFSLTSKGALSPAVKDLAIGILTLVPHTPIHGIGLNFMGHYRLKSEEEYHKIGDVLAPKEIWKQLFQGEHESIGMTNLAVVVEPCTRGGKPRNGDRKHITVQPSDRFRNNGVFFSLNDHHNTSTQDDDSSTSAERAAQIVDANWEPIWEEALHVFDGIITLALEL